MNLIQSFFWTLTWNVRSAIRRWSERNSLRRFEDRHDVAAAICENCREPFELYDDDIILTYDDTLMCRPCAERIEAIEVAKQVAPVAVAS